MTAQTFNLPFSFHAFIFMIAFEWKEKKKTNKKKIGAKIKKSCKRMSVVKARDLDDRMTRIVPFIPIAIRKKRKSETGESKWNRGTHSKCQ